MSGLACLLDRRGERVDRRRIEGFGNSLAIYGEESSTLCTGPVGIIVQHEKSDCASQRYGPIRDERSGLVFAVAGRFSLVDTNATKTRRGLGHPHQEGYARWILERWTDQGPRLLDEIAGSFTLVVADPTSGRVIVWRDHLGDIKVYHHIDEQRFIAATEAGAILHDETVVAAPDQQSIARFLGFRFPHTERSFFRCIRELAPAHRLEVDSKGFSIRPYWRFPSGTGTEKATTGEVVDEFLDQIQHSMRHHLSGLPAGHVGLSLSGGLDSTTLAAVAPRDIRAYSWFFEATPDPDEDRNIDTVSRHLNLPVRLINGDGHGPLSGDFTSRFVHDSSPYINPFAALKGRLYDAAREDGCRRMIVGDGGDVLFGARPFWLRDALAGGQPWALRSLARTVRHAFRGDPFCRAALRKLMPFQSIGRGYLARHEPSWMTAEGVSLLPSERVTPIYSEGPWARRLDMAIGARNIELESEERRLFFQCGVERANPFWHRPLLEMALRLPATWLHRDGTDKVLLREAMRDRLPVRVLDSGRVGLLGGFFLRGIEDHHREIVEFVFQRPRSDWQRYVRRDWLEPFLCATESITFGHTILWRVISYELWVRRVF